MTMLSFLELPPEICNLIYEYLVPDTLTKPNLTLQRSKHHQLLKCYQSVSVVSRQVRAEFRPLFIFRTTMLISLRKMPAFFSMFFDKEAVAKPRRVVVLVTASNVGEDVMRDVRPVLVAKARHRNLAIPFKADGPRAQRKPGQESLCNYLSQTLNGPRRHFLDDGESGLFRGIFLLQVNIRHRHVVGHGWIFVVQKKSGKLDNHERARLSKTCRWICRNILGPHPHTDVEYYGGTDMSLNVYNNVDA